MDEFLGQTILYDALTTSSATTLSGLITGVYTYNKIDAVYPYISFGRVGSSPMDTHQGRGAETVHYINIYTKPGTLGYYSVKTISKEIDKLLSYKNLAYTSSDYILAGSIKGVSDFEMDGEYINGTLQYKLRIFEKQ
jgi:hypothetical protein